ncbi:hypothetical protein [Paraburkholderia tagetis]|uniref:Abi-like protein n=1 Tax=Paraburkholderia tagetis TaxID=2913261 RepID=A0A9X1RR03_9BURK|nr:hypothetical protein [Paraburkholderia tagetis]MCG5075660.1 hypothetical protein [Paraburkholderia tagetis]
MELADDTLAAITLMLSGERLGTFLTLAGSPRPAIALHQQTLQVAGTLMCVTAVVEIALRNTICDHLTHHFGTADWLRDPPAPFGWRAQEKTRIGEALASAQRAAYTKMDTAQKRAIDDRLFRNGVPAGLTHERHAKIRQQSLAVPNGQVIAQLTLYFWKRLFSIEYESSLWRTVLKRVFPDKTLRRADVAIQLERIYQTRNRIAHHEPVYGHRLHDTLEAIDFIITRLGQHTPCHATPLAQLLAGEWQTLSAQAKGLRTSIDAMSQASSTLPTEPRALAATVVADQL